MILGKQLSYHLQTYQNTVRLQHKVLFVTYFILIGDKTYSEFKYHPQGYLNTVHNAM